VSNNVPFTKLQEDLIVPADWTAANASASNEVVRQTTAGGGSSLATFIKSIYSNPNFTPNDDFLVLRLNPDNTPTATATQRYQIPYAQTPTWPGTTSATATVPTLSITFAAAALEGDVNGDHIVDLGDVNYVTARWLNTGSDGDANHDGTIDLGDINYITARWLNTGEPGMAAALAGVPEPASIGLLAVGSVALLRRRRA